MARGWVRSSRAGRTSEVGGSQTHPEFVFTVFYSSQGEQAFSLLPFLSLGSVGQEQLLEQPFSPWLVPWGPHFTEGGVISVYYGFQTDCLYEDTYTMKKNC